MQGKSATNIVSIIMEYYIVYCIATGWNAIGIIPDTKCARKHLEKLGTYRRFRFTELWRLDDFFLGS